MQPNVPDILPITSLNYQGLISLVGKANSILSQYNGLLEGMVNPHILLAPMRRKEAVLSSRIEGTQASFSDTLNYEAGSDSVDEKTLDIEEIQNYKEALHIAEDLLQERPFIHLNMIKKIHAILLSGVRGQNKSKGEFRQIQNWIGVAGSTMNQAKYIPPTPVEMNIALDNWEKYLNDDDIDVLIQLACVHAQFEIIHPFLDGNGRIGRLIIPLFLYVKSYLKYPVFYLSEYLEANRDEYYYRLNQITQKNDWQGWIEFFLTAIVEQSKLNTQKAKDIIDLYNNMKAIVQDITKSQYASLILDTLFISPILSSRQFFNAVQFDSKATSNRILQRLCEKNVLIISKKGAGNAPSIYTFTALIDLVENK